MFKKNSPLSQSHTVYDGRCGTGRRTIAVILALVLLVAAGLGIWYRAISDQDNEFSQALLAVKEGRLADARQALRTLQEQDQTQAYAAYLRGAILLRKGYFYPALDEFKASGESKELKLASQTRIGEVWYHLGRHVEAQALLLQVIETEPDTVEAHRWLAASYYDQGAIHNAIFHLERTAGLDRTDPRPHRLLGLIYKDYERYDDAVPCYEESLRRNATQADAADIRYEMAVCYTKLRQYREALTALTKCPDVAAVLALRAECHYGLGALSAAKELLQQALKQDSANLDALLLHGTILLEEGNGRNAVETFQQAKRAHPRDYAVHFKLSQAYTQIGEKELAAATHKEAESIRELRNEFARLHQVAWDQPTDIGVRLQLADLASQLDRDDLAEVWRRSAAALKPRGAQKDSKE